GLVRDAHEADDVAQEVVTRLVAGAFRGADARRGRFRDLLAVAARHTAWKHLARKARRGGKPWDLAQVAADPGDDAGGDAALVRTWRQTLLELADAALREHQARTPGCVFWTLLRLRADHPDADSEELAALLSAAAGRPFRADALRQQLRRARLCFA